MALTTFRIGTPRGRDEGLRVGAVRLLPRGVPKTEYARRDYFDVWMPLLAPSRELLKWLKARDPDEVRAEFFRRYRREILGDTERRQTLLLLALLGERTDIGLGCYCEDESRCHRSELFRLVREAAAGEHG